MKIIEVYGRGGVGLPSFSDLSFQQTQQLLNGLIGGSMML